LDTQNYRYQVPVLVVKEECLPIIFAALLLLSDGDSAAAGLEDPRAGVGVHLGGKGELRVVSYRMVGHLHSTRREIMRIH